MDQAEIGGRNGTAHLRESTQFLLFFFERGIVVKRKQGPDLIDLRWPLEGHNIWAIWPQNGLWVASS